MGFAYVQMSNEKKEKRAPVCLGYLLGMKYYPGIYGIIP